MGDDQVYLVLVTGFLGSGKTSLIMGVAEAARAAGRSVAIVVNEIGEVGIDDQLLRRLDLDVWELTNGCICCSLSGDLVETLHMLDRDHEPDLVIVEASGAADPANLVAALPLYRGGELAGTRWLVVLDPFRLPILVQVMTPLVTSAIELADQVVVAKADVASDEELAATEAIAAEINPDTPVLRLDLTKPLSAAAIRELLP